MLLKVVLSSYIDVREVTEPAWEKANLEFDLKSDLQENDPSTFPDSSEATVAFSRTTTPATAVTATSASTPESSPKTMSTTTPSSTTLAIPSELLGVTTTTSSSSSELIRQQSETTTATTTRTTTIPNYHTNLVEELRALREEYELHGVCLQC